MLTNFVYERYTGKVEFVPGTEFVKGRCVVYAHEYVRPAKQLNGVRLTAPKVLVVLKNIRDDKSLSSTHTIEVKITFLPLLRIGTVIENGYCIGFSNNVVQLKTELNQNPGHWKHVTKEAYLADFELNYPLRKQDNSTFIEFTHHDGYKLLIPSLTYFSACYGFSAELKRILVTYPWPEVCHRICGPISGYGQFNGLVINLPKKLVDNDATFVAHALYDNVAQRAAKSLYSQIAINHRREQSLPVFLEVTPWFLGTMQVELRGVWINPNTFFGVAFEGISEPDGDRILMGRENTNLTVTKGDGSALAWKNSLNTVRNLPLTVLHSDYDPDPGEAPLEIIEPKLRVLGHPRAKTKVLLKQSQNKSGIKSDKPASGHGSSGERQPNDVKISPVNQIPTLEFQRGGALIGMWQASRELYHRHPSIIRNARCYLKNDEYSASPEPLLISLDYYTDAERELLTEEQQRWIYSSYSQRKIRGLLVIEFEFRDFSYVIVELERKHGTAFNEEHIRGLIFEKTNVEEFDNLIDSLKGRLRITSGNINKSVAIFKKAFTFNHPASKTLELKCQKAIINAFRKMGLPADDLKILRAGLKGSEN
uniref:Uncharacterized protein n=1 Tax=Rheinheimera sp. BAL341 TaxID=1708203 RepID=A0A486XFN9_9GAMM